MGSEAAGLAEGADDGGGVLVLGVDCVVEAADVGSGEFAGEIGEGGAELGKLGERGLADDGDGVVGRKVVAVVFEGDEAEGVDEAVGGVAGDDVHLMIHERTVDEPEVHHFGRLGEMEIVAVAPAAEAVGALEEFIADAGTPFWRGPSDVGKFLQMEILRVVASDDHRECVFEAQRLSDFEMESLGVKLLDAMVDGARIALRRFIQHGCQSGAGVLDVEIELAGEQRFVHEEAAAQVRFSNDGDAGFGFDVLGEQLGKNDLLGEKLGANRNFRLARGIAGRSQ